MALIVLCALLVGSPQFESQKSVFVLGDEPALALTIVSSALMRVSVNIGEVSAPRFLGDGRYTVSYKPPAARFPQLAIFYAEDASGHAWFVLPLAAREKLSLETKPLAMVRVSIGASAFGPLRADARGRVVVPVVIPPGIDNARVRSVDRAGNTKEVALPLSPPRYARARVVAPAGARASWQDKDALPIEVFIADPTGAPVRESRLAVKASVGTVSPLQALGGGAFVVSYRAPVLVGAGFADVSLASGESARVAVVAGTPARITFAPEPKEVPAEEETQLRLGTRVFDAHDNIVDAKPAVQADLGVVDGDVLRVPANSQGRRAIVITASLPPLVATQRLPIGAARPTSGEIDLGMALVRAGDEPGQARVKLRDRFGNSVSNAVLEVVSPEATITTRFDEKKDAYAVALRFPASATPGPARLSLRAHGFVVSAPLTILPARKAWGFSIGAFVSAQTNLKHAHSGNAALELALRPGYLPLQFFIGGGVRLYLPVTVASVHVAITAAPVSAGVRFLLPVSLAWSLVFSAHGGIQPTWSTLQETGGTPQARFFLAPLFGAAVGAVMRAGPGSLSFELVGQGVIGGGDIRGNVGGYGVRVGYAYDVR